MNESYVEVRGIKTQVLSFGHTAGDPFDDSIKEMVLIIPGCPGIPKYYPTYMKTVYNYLEKQMPVYTVSHCGIADPVEIELNIPKRKGNEHLFNIDGQVKHKIEFITRYIPAHVKIHLIGHSFGSYVITQLLKNEEINKRIHKAYLLFPAIDHVGESYNGRMTRRVQFLFPLVEVISFLMFLFPHSIRAIFVMIYCYIMNLPKNQLEPHLANCRPPVVNKGLALLSEIMNVKELEVEVIKANVKKLKFYYGTAQLDGWSSEENYHHLKDLVPDADAHVDDCGIFHCFQLRHGLKMGQITADWILNDRALI